MVAFNLPGLSDKELQNLHGNAVRLAESGTSKQQEQAKELLPAIDREVEDRAQAKAAMQRERLAAAKEQRMAKSRARKAAAEAEKAAAKG